MVESFDRRSGGGGKKPPETPKPEPAREPQPQPSPAAEAPKEGARGPEPQPQPQAEPRPSPGGPLPAPTFFEVTQLLFVQALAALEEGEDPQTGQKSEADLDIAKHYIGLMELLQAKTKGNLSGVEDKHLSECLHQSRLAFIAKTRTAAKKA